MYGSCARRGAGEGAGGARRNSRAVLCAGEGGGGGVLPLPLRRHSAPAARRGARPAGPRAAPEGRQAGGRGRDACRSHLRGSSPASPPGRARALVRGAGARRQGGAREGGGRAEALKARRIWPRASAQGDGGGRPRHCGVLREGWVAMSSQLEAFVVKSLKTLRAEVPRKEAKLREDITAWLGTCATAAAHGAAAARVRRARWLARAGRRGAARGCAIWQWTRWGTLCSRRCSLLLRSARAGHAACDCANFA